MREHILLLYYIDKNMGKSQKYLINTKSFITNLIKEGRLDEANRILKSESLEQLEYLSKQDSDIGRIINSDLVIELKTKANKKHCGRAWNRFRVSYVLYFLMIITIFYHNRIISFLR